MGVTISFTLRNPHDYENPGCLLDRSDHTARGVHDDGLRAAKVQRFDEIDVHRVNVREPDGTLRLVISNDARLPGVIVRGKENPPVDRPVRGPAVL